LNGSTQDMLERLHSNHETLVRSAVQFSGGPQLIKDEISSDNLAPTSPKNMQGE
jgi:hypothetical protein